MSVYAHSLGYKPSVEQIHISYTGILGELSVDFVSSDSEGYVAFSIDKSNFTNVKTTSLTFNDVGTLHQGLMTFPATAGAKGYYKVGGGRSGHWSDVFEIEPVPSSYPSQKYAVFGDFGYSNDVCLDDLIKSAQNGVYDAVLHVGDWGESSQSAALH